MSDPDENSVREPDFHSDDAPIFLTSEEVIRISAFVSGEKNPEGLLVPEELKSLKVEVPAEVVNAVKRFVFKHAELRDTDFGHRILYAEGNQTLRMSSKSCGFGPGN